MIWRLGSGMSGLCVAVGAFGLLAAGSAVAEKPDTGVAAVLACRAITDPAAQLACFKAASDRLAQAPGQAPVPVTPEPAPAPVHRAFGAPAPKPPKPPRPPKGAKRPPPSADQQAVLTLLSIYDPGDGRIVFRFDDGSTWRETESTPLLGSGLKPGVTVTLEKGSLGGYFMDLPHRASIRVYREGGE